MKDIVPVLAQDRRPHVRTALRKAYRRRKTSRRQIEDMLLILFLVEDRQCKRERSHMGYMRHISRMHIMTGGIHVYGPHVQRLIKRLHAPDRLRRRLLRIADYACMTVEKPRHGRPWTAVLCSRHRMRGHILPAAGMVFHASCEMFLRRTYIHHDLPVTIRRETVQHHRQKPYSRSYRHSQHDQVALPACWFISMASFILL